MKNVKIRLGVVLMIFGSIFLLSDSIINVENEIGGTGWLINYILLFSGGVIFIMADWRT